MSQVIWYLQTTFDRKVAYPNEELYASAILNNPNRYPIFIGTCYWHFSCYPDHLPGERILNEIVPPDKSISIPSWQLPIPNIAEGQYGAKVSFDTWLWDNDGNNWINLGKIHPDRYEPFHIIHTPRFRAFISRSNRDIDRPIVDSMISVIQQWGFDTHTVGINEIEKDTDKIPERIINEIVKSDCIFAIATPRDISSVPALYKTLTWLHNEVSFSFMAQKLTLLIVDESVVLDGLISTQNIPKMTFSSVDLFECLNRLNNIMPVIRDILLRESHQRWKQKRLEEIEEIRYQSFIAGMVYQKRLILEK